MLRRHAKAGVLVVAVAVLVVEGFFVYRWYDRYQVPGATSGDPVGAPASEGTTAGGTASEGPIANGDAPLDAEDTAFAHRATEGNSRGDYTYLDHQRINGEPGAVVLAEPSPGRGGDGESTYGRNIGVWYEPGAGRWAVFNQDRTPVPAGAAFEVILPPESESFVHRAEPANTVGNATYLDDTLLNGEPDAAVSVTQNWNPGGGAGVYNDHPVGVFYDQDVREWALYNTDGTPMPQGAAFNVAVSGDPAPPG